MLTNEQRMGLVLLDRVWKYLALDNAAVPADKINVVAINEVLGNNPKYDGIWAQGNPLFHTGWSVKDWWEGKGIDDESKS